MKIVVFLIAFAIGFTATIAVFSITNQTIIIKQAPPINNYYYHHRI
jgi:uncharacterized membrane protein YfbV (UPF0208 family)